jgi:hypothetical protein
VYTIDDKRMINYNKNNPFVIIAKNKERDLNNSFINTLKAFITYFPIAILWVFMMIIIFIVFRKSYIYAVLLGSSIEVLIGYSYIFYIFYKKILKSPKIAALHKTMDAEVSDVLGMNNEDILNLICSMTELTGKSDVYGYLIPRITLIYNILFCILLIIGIIL